MGSWCVHETRCKVKKFEFILRLSCISLTMPQRNTISTVSQMVEERSKSSSGATCRICFSAKRKNELISNACLCKGSIAHIHGDCLRKWMKLNQKNECELCQTKFMVKEVKPTFIDWVRSDIGHHRCLLIDLMCMIFLTPITSASIYLCIYGGISSEIGLEIFAFFGLIIILIVSYFLWLFICIRHHKNNFLLWQQKNPKLVPINKKKTNFFINKRSIENNNSTESHVNQNNFKVNSFNERQDSSQNEEIQLTRIILV